MTRKLKRDMYAALMYFRDFDDQNVYEKCHCAQLKLAEKFISSGKTVILTVEIGLSYKSFFVLDMLHISRVTIQRSGR